VHPARQGTSLSADLAVVAVVVSFAAVAVTAGMVHSAVSPPLLPGTGPPAGLRAVADGVGLGGLGRTAAALLSLGVVTASVAAFLFGLREAWHGRLSARKVLWFAIAFQVVAAALPVLLSRDVYSYAIYARIDAVHHANPYVATPLDFRSDPLFPFVGSVWRGAPSIYGPAFTMLSGAIGRLTSSPAGLVWAFKIIGGLAAIGTLLLVAWIAKRVAPGRAAFAIALFGWNPAIVVYATGGGHNDLLVALCIAGALAVLIRGGVFDRAGRGVHAEQVGRRWEWPRAELLAVGLLTLGALVKASAAPALALAVVASVAARPAGRRLRLLCAEAAVVLVLVVAFAAPYWQTHNPTLGVSSLATHRGWVTATRLLLATLGGIAENLWGAGGRTAVEVVIRISVTATAFIGLVLVAIAVVRRIARRGPTEGGETRPGEGRPAGVVTDGGGSTWAAPWTAVAEGAAWGWALLLFIVASPVLLPWYMAWMLPVAWLLPRGGRAVAVMVSCLLCITHAIAEPELVFHVYTAQLWIGHDVVGPLMLATLVWVAVRSVRMARGRSPFEDRALAPPPVGRGERVPARAEAD
jgi:hypothetical protein